MRITPVPVFKYQEHHQFVWSSGGLTSRATTAALFNSDWWTYFSINEVDRSAEAMGGSSLELSVRHQSSSPADKEPDVVQ